MLYRTAGVVHFWWWNVNNKVKKNWIFVLAVWAWDKACSFVGQKKVDFGRSTDIFFTKSISGREKSFPVSIVRVINGVRIDQCVTLTNNTGHFQGHLSRVSPFFYGKPLNLVYWVDGKPRNLVFRYSKNTGKTGREHAQGTWRLNQSIDIFNEKKNFTVSIIPWIYFEILDDGLRPCLHRCFIPPRDPFVKSCNTSLFGPIFPPLRVRHRWLCWFWQGTTEKKNLNRDNFNQKIN